MQNTVKVLLSKVDLTWPDQTRPNQT